MQPISVDLLNTQPKALYALHFAAGLPLSSQSVTDHVGVKHLGHRARTKLWNLPAQLLCSVIGTCLGTAELRKLVMRCSGGQFKQTSDLEIHEEGVRLATNPEPGGRVLHKAIDQRYLATVKRFDRANTPSELTELWEESKRSGEIPGAYWAILTHRSTSVNLRQAVFGDVHMLSHLVGAANRADIRRLTQLETENTELLQKTERQQRNLRDAIVSRDEVIKGLREQLVERISQDESCSQHIQPNNDGELKTLRELVATLQRQLVTSTTRCHQVVSNATSMRTTLAKTHITLQISQENERELRKELDVTENQLMLMRGEADHSMDRLRAAVAGRTIVYIGGRPGATHAMRDLIEGANGDFIHHDGGIEDRRGLLVGAVNKADLVIFPIDCVSHDAATGLKRLCQ